MGVTVAGQKKAFEHVIRQNWCKGCNICVAFCPKNVLALSSGKVRAEKPGDCVGCHLCEMRCPDFAIEVREKDQSAPGGRDAAKTDFSIPPEAL